MKGGGTVTGKVTLNDTTGGTVTLTTSDATPAAGTKGAVMTMIASVVSLAAYGLIAEVAVHPVVRLWEHKASLPASYYPMFTSLLALCGAAWMGYAQNRRHRARTLIFATLVGYAAGAVAFVIAVEAGGPGLVPHGMHSIDVLRKVLLIPVLLLAPVGGLLLGGVMLAAGLLPFGKGVEPAAGPQEGGSGAIK